jgi:hypothetical protein
VTTLRARARSFSGGVRLKAPSEPFDKHGADLVAREGQMTTGTVVPPLTQVLGNRLSVLRCDVLLTAPPAHARGCCLGAGSPVGAGPSQARRLSGFRPLALTLTPEGSVRAHACIIGLGTNLGLTWDLRGGPRWEFPRPCPPTRRTLHSPPAFKPESPGGSCYGARRRSTPARCS